MEKSNRSMPTVISSMENLKLRSKFARVESAKRNAVQALPGGDPVLSTAEKLEQLTKSHEICLCCSRCLVDVHDRPKGEYYLFNITCSLGNRIWYSKHEECRRDVIVAKDPAADKWNQIRNQRDKPGPSGLYGMCEYAIDESDYVVEKQSCPSGDECCFAHTERECQVWSDMFRLNMKYAELGKAIVEDVAKHEKEMQEALANQMRQTMESAAAASASANDASPIPADAVRPGARYKSPNLEFRDGEKISMRVRVTKFDNPDYFCFQLADNLVTMEECWRRMNAFYNIQADERYKINHDDIYRNLPLAMRFKSKKSGLPYWRRGEVMSYLSTCEVIEVCDVDFGGIHYLRVEDLRFLSEQFFGYEKQAVEATLAYASPIFGAGWTREASEFAKGFVAKESLNAEVIGMTGIAHAKLAVLLTDKPPNADGVEDLSRLLVKNRFASAFRRTQPTHFGPTPVPVSRFQKQVRVGRLPKDKLPKKKKEEDEWDIIPGSGI